MSIENVGKFFEELKKAPSLAEELSGTADGQSLEAFVSFACSKGFEVTAEEFEEYAARAQELSDEELDQVSGGNNKVCTNAGINLDAAKAASCGMISY